MWVTFRDGQSALTAVKKKSICISDIEFHFKLKTENWLSQVEREIALCTTNTVQLCTSSPTSKIPLIDWKIYSVRNENQSLFIISGDYNSLGIPRKPPNRPKSPPSRPAPPIRPPLPKSPKHAPKAGVISVIPHTNVTNNQTPCGPPPIPPAPVAASQTRSSKLPSPSGSSSGSSNSSPINDNNRSLPPIESMNLNEQQSAAIYEEINDDVVSTDLLIERISFWGEKLLKKIRAISLEISF